MPGFGFSGPIVLGRRLPASTERQPLMADPVIPEDMSVNRAVFTKNFGTPSSPGNPVGFHAFASEEPQSFPRRFIEAAIKAGRAQPVPKIRRKAAEEAPPEPETPSE